MESELYENTFVNHILKLIDEYTINFELANDASDEDGEKINVAIKIRIHELYDPDISTFYASYSHYLLIPDFCDWKSLDGRPAETSAELAEVISQDICDMSECAARACRAGHHPSANWLATNPNFF